jgi:Kef-type K+ transport system membrane component KefB
MHYLSEDNIFLFLVQVFTLGFSRILGDLLRRFRQPAYLRKLLSGFLGPTILGRFFLRFRQPFFLLKQSR